MVDEKGQPKETAVYNANGSLKQRTFYATDAEGRVLTARTVDPQSQPKWTDQYFYGAAGDTRPMEIRRAKADGQIVSVRFLQLPDGTRKRIVIGPDGKHADEADEATLLGEEIVLNP